MTAKVPVVLVALGFPLTIAWITLLSLRIHYTYSFQ